MTRKKLIALCGYQGSGKDSLGKLFINDGYRKVAFADPVKDAISLIYDVPRELLEGDTEESRRYRETPSFEYGGLSARQVMQKLATEVCRKIHSETWTNFFYRRVCNLKDENIVVTDLRFPNELFTLKRIYSHSVLVVYIDRPSARPNEFIRGLPVFLKKLFIHESECWNEWLDSQADLGLVNYSTIEDMYEDLKRGIAKNSFKFSDRHLDEERERFNLKDSY